MLTFNNIFSPCEAFTAIMNILTKIGMGSTLATLTLAVTTLSASANTITFESGNTGVNALTGSNTENGFTYTVTSGLNFVLDSSRGNPPSALGVGFQTLDSGFTVTTGDTIEITQVGGGLFTFDSFDLASTGNALLSQTVSWTGFVGGLQTESLTGVNSISVTFSSQAVSFSAPIDTLVLTFTDFNDAGLYLDNLVLTPQSTPEPSAILGLLAVSSIGTLFGRKKG
ncbi:MAG: PEP-CTERM sorting domain-containing protein [Microcystaceae cyanobacterium]